MGVCQWTLSPYLPSSHNVLFQTVSTLKKTVEEQNIIGKFKRAAYVVDDCLSTFLQGQTAIKTEADKKQTREQQYESLKSQKHTNAPCTTQFSFAGSHIESVLFIYPQISFVPEDFTAHLTLG